MNFPLAADSTDCKLLGGKLRKPSFLPGAHCHHSLEKADLIIQPTGYTNEVMAPGQSKFCHVESPLLQNFLSIFAGIVNKAHAQFILKNGFAKITMFIKLSYLLWHKRLPLSSLVMH